MIWKAAKLIQLGLVGDELLDPCAFVDLLLESRRTTEHRGEDVYVGSTWTMARRTDRLGKRSAVEEVQVVWMSRVEKRGSTLSVKREERRRSAMMRRRARMDAETFSGPS